MKTWPARVMLVTCLLQALFAMLDRDFSKAAMFEILGYLVVRSDD